MKRIVTVAALALVLGVAPALAQKGPTQGGGGGGRGDQAAQALVGTWGDNGDCRQHITLRPDGSFQLFDGGTGRWTLINGQLTFYGAGGTYEQRLEWIDSNNVMLTNPDGSVGRSQRCPAPNY